MLVSIKLAPHFITIQDQPWEGLLKDRSELLLKVPCHLWIACLNLLGHSRAQPHTVLAHIEGKGMMVMAAAVAATRA
jgi:hypothetical protein